MHIKYGYRPLLRLLIASALVVLCVVLIACSTGSNAPSNGTGSNTVPRPTTTHIAIVPTVAGPVITPNSLNMPSGAGVGMPTSRIHLTIGGSLSGTLTITGVAQNVPIQQGDGPFQLYFFLEDAQGPALLLQVHDYAGPGHYPLHGAFAPPHDDLFLWTSSDTQQYYYMWAENYDTACEMDVSSDTVSSYAGLHEVQGSFDCTELLLHNQELTNSIVVAAHFDVFVNVLA